MTYIEQELLDGADTIKQFECFVEETSDSLLMRRASALLVRAREALAAVHVTDNTIKVMYSINDAPRGQPEQWREVGWRCELCLNGWHDTTRYDPDAHAADCPMRLVSAALKALEEA